MKICFATYQSTMLLKGGPRTQILETKRELERLGVEVRLFESWQEFRPDAVDIVHLFGANIGSYHLSRELRKLNVPLVVTPIFYSRKSVPFIRAIRTADSVIRSLARGTWTDYGLVAEICSWARAVLPNTEAEARLLRNGLGIDREKITVVPNGVEERFARGDPALFQEKYRVSDFILNVGHIGPERKNVHRLIIALAKINHPAVIAGRIEDTPAGRRCLEAARGNPHLLILDSIDHDSDLLASAYAACDVFVLPSQFETPGIAALEAGLAGAKVVITKYGGTKEYFRDHAEYVEPTSWELIHHGLLTALNKPKDDDLRRHIEQNFLWKHVAERTADVYRKVLGG